MTVFQGAVDAMYAAFGIDAVYTPAGGDPVTARVIARRPDMIVGFGESRILAETTTFEVRASQLASPHADDRRWRKPSSSRASRSARSGPARVDVRCEAISAGSPSAELAAAARYSQLSPPMPVQGLEAEHGDLSAGPLVAGAPYQAPAPVPRRPGGSAASYSAASFAFVGAGWCSVAVGPVRAAAWPARPDDGTGPLAI